jgi:hypothetical protein
MHTHTHTQAHTHTQTGLHAHITGCPTLVLPNHRRHATATTATTATIPRSEAFDDPVIPKFLYGTHYSTVGAVLYYLIRMEPYTTYALALQSGNFDHSTRLFKVIHLSLARPRTHMSTHARARATTHA